MTQAIHNAQFLSKELKRKLGRTYPGSSHLDCRVGLWIVVAASSFSP